MTKFQTHTNSFGTLWLPVMKRSKLIMKLENKRLKKKSKQYRSLGGTNGSLINLEIMLKANTEIAILFSACCKSGIALP